MSRSRTVKRVTREPLFEVQKHYNEVTLEIHQPPEDTRGTVNIHRLSPREARQLANVLLEKADEE